MRRAVALSLAGLAAGAVVVGPTAGAASASGATGYPPPCPVRPAVDFPPGDVIQINVGCLVSVTVAQP